jgi:hypothetical protein
MPPGVPGAGSFQLSWSTSGPAGVSRSCEEVAQFLSRPVWDLFGKEVTGLKGAAADIIRPQPPQGKETTRRDVPGVQWPVTAPENERWALDPTSGSAVLRIMLGFDCLGREASPHPVRSWERGPAVSGRLPRSIQVAFRYRIHPSRLQITTMTRTAPPRRTMSCHEPRSTMNCLLSWMDWKPQLSYRKPTFTVCSMPSQTTRRFACLTCPT